MAKANPEQWNENVRLVTSRIARRVAERGYGREHSRALELGVGVFFAVLLALGIGLYVKTNVLVPKYELRYAGQIYQVKDKDTDQYRVHVLPEDAIAVGSTSYTTDEALAADLSCNFEAGDSVAVYASADNPKKLYLCLPTEMSNWGSYLVFTRRAFG